MRRDRPTSVCWMEVGVSVQTICILPWAGWQPYRPFNTGGEITFPLQGWSILQHSHQAPHQPCWVQSWAFPPGQSTESWGAGVRPSSNIKGQGLSSKGQGAGSRHMSARGEMIRAIQPLLHSIRHAVWCRLVVKICIECFYYPSECLAETPAIKDTLTREKKTEVY